MAISASFSFIRPKSPICFPNALRSLAYFEEVISTCFEPPTQEAPSVKRPAFKMLKATMWPRPISCSRFSLGTLQFSRKIGAVEDVVRAFFIQLRAGQRILRVGAGLRFGKAVGADPFAGSELR